MTKFSRFMSTPYLATMKSALRKLFKAAPLPMISTLFALLSFPLAKDHGWTNAIDWQTINLLFCLMFVVAGLRECNLFAWLAENLLSICHTVRKISFALLTLTFFGAMLITNDVVLIVFVPFAIYLYNMLSLRRRIPFFLVLLTLAANIGSTATPIGNPQNLFLFSIYNIAPLPFFQTTLPLTAVGYLLLSLCIFILPHRAINFPLTTAQPLTAPKHVFLYSLLFSLCLLSVFRLLPGVWLFSTVLLSSILFARRLLQKIDYGLLLTFIAFFIFSHNITHLIWLKEFLSALLECHTLLTALATSQIISNVPAALLLQPFATDWQALLLGVNLGGLGTPIASLASLIALNIYLRERDGRLAYFMRFFLLFNLLLLIPLLLFTLALF